MQTKNRGFGLKYLVDERLHLHYLAETEWLRRKVEDTA